MISVLGPLFPILIILLVLALLQGVLYLVSRLRTVRYDEKERQELHAMSNYTLGRFHNAPNVKEFRRPDKMFGLLGRTLFGKEERRPKTLLPVVTPAVNELGKTSELEVIWLGHSTTLIAIEGKVLLTDPVFGERCSPVSFAGPKRFHQPPITVEELERLDAVLISHNHYDHLERDTIQFLAHRGVTFIVPFGVDHYLRRWGVPPGAIRRVAWWESVDLGGVTITSTPSSHFSQRAFERSNTTLWSGYAIRGANRSCYFGGDSGWFEGFKEIGKRLGPFDLTLLEIGAWDRSWATLHLGPENAIRAHLALKGKHFMPIHWGTFSLALHDWFAPPEEAFENARRHDVTISIPPIGGTLDPLKPPSGDYWWREHVVNKSRLERFKSLDVSDPVVTL